MGTSGVVLVLVAAAGGNKTRLATGGQESVLEDKPHDGVGQFRHISRLE